MSTDGLSKNSVIIQDIQSTTKYLTLELTATLHKLRNIQKRQKSNLENGNQRRMVKANGFYLTRMLNSSSEEN